MAQGSGWDSVGALHTGVCILSEITKVLSNDACTLLRRYKFSHNFCKWPCKMISTIFILYLPVCHICSFVCAYNTKRKFCVGLYSQNCEIYHPLDFILYV